MQSLVLTWTRPAVKSRSGMAMRANTTVISSTRGTGRCRQVAGCFAPAGGTCCPAARQRHCQYHIVDRACRQTHQTAQEPLNLAIDAEQPMRIFNEKIEASGRKQYVELPRIVR